MIENTTGICRLINTKATPKLCDICKSTAALLFCRKDTVYLCIACDFTLHSHTKHERVWMCEVCEQSPARVTCKPDAANLCDTCDRNIHSANPLARRHERIPIVPFYDSAAEAVANSTAFNLINQVSDCYENTESNSSVEIPLVTTSIDATSVVMKSMDLFSVSDSFFDFGFAIPTDVSFGSRLHESVNDLVVPVQTTVAPIDAITSSVTNSYKSQSHSELSSSIEAEVVPEENSNSNSNSNSSLNSMMFDASNTIMLPVNGGGMNCDKKEDKFSAVDREARVLRYKEKRKNRKFEKKIRYASRKAYAETRPRIKGRFVKRTELTTEVDVDRWLLTTLGGSNCYGGDVEYGVVPSF